MKRKNPDLYIDRSSFGAPIINEIEYELRKNDPNLVIEYDPRRTGKDKDNLPVKLAEDLGY